MSAGCRLLLRQNPRSICLTTSTHVLTFHAYPGSPPRVSTSFTPLPSTKLNLYRPVSPTTYLGTLGLIQLAGDIFLVVISSARECARIRPHEPVFRIDKVELWCLSRAGLDFTGEEGEGLGLGEDGAEHMGVALRRVLSQGTFYYASECDVTRRLQDRGGAGAGTDGLQAAGMAGEKGFLWNEFLVRPLREFMAGLGELDRRAMEAQRLVVGCIRGFAESARIGAVTLTLVSRLGCRRAGTRFNSRGMDDEGNVANFVETEVVIWDAHGEGSAFAYCQVRGSIPIFWEQQAGLLPNQQKIQITRSPEATQPTFDLHFEQLTVKYGPVHIVNLLSATKPGEVELSQRYRYHTKHSSLNSDTGGGELPAEQLPGGGLGKKSNLGAGHGSLLRATEYDFHAETAGRYEAAHAIRRLLDDSAESFGFYLCEGRDGVVLQQEGVFRTNCLDCLDRTNLIQGIISQMSIEQFLRQREQTAGMELWNAHSRLWADNGDALSRIYAGTGALKSSYTRTGKSSFAGMLADAGKSMARAYVNNFTDKSRQEVVDTLLGRLVAQRAVLLYDPLHSYIHKELKAREKEFTSVTPVRVQVITMNLNGRRTGLQHDLTPILFPEPRSQPPADIIAVGFQEIVELSPQQILSTDPAVRQEWEKVVTLTLNNSPASPADRKYILLRTSQLVGCALLLFVADKHLGKVKNVEGALKKTGVSGMAGNKGAVGIRLDFAATSMCFLSAHLAAGLNSVYERNQDYRTIAHGLNFLRGRRIDDHDVVIWAGDFNYRINLTNEICRSYVADGNLAALLEADQLRTQKEAGEAFEGYIEPRIEFMPTYRFDLGTDNYDTSEKARIPAWTDRVLYKARGTKMRCLRYDSVAASRFSDHRPVYAELDVGVKVVDEARREEVELQARRSAASKMREEGQAQGSLLDLDDEPSVSPAPALISSPVEKTIQYPTLTPTPPAPPPPRKSGPVTVGTGAALNTVGTVGTQISPMRRLPPPFPYPNYSNPAASTSNPSLPPPLPKRAPTFPENTTPSSASHALASLSLNDASNLARSPSAPQLSPPAQKLPPSIPRKPVQLSTPPKPSKPASLRAQPHPAHPSLGTPPAYTDKSGPVPADDAGRGAGHTMHKEKVPPAPPPPRRAGASLLDEDDEVGGLGGSWEVLQPMGGR